MKFKLKLALAAILLVIVIVINYTIDNYFTYFIANENVKHYIFIFVCIIFQDRIINFIIKRALKNNSQLYDIKKQVYFMYKNKQENFEKYYNQACIFKKIKLVLIIKLELCYTKLSDISEEEIYLKIDKNRLEDIYKNVSFKNKLLIRRQFEKYNMFLSQSEAIYFECETKDIIKRDESVSIIEYSLIWLSYLVLICQILGLNSFNSETVIYFKTFILLNIIDVLKHISEYQLLLKLEKEKYLEFNDLVLKMEKMILNPENTLYKVYNGELVPFFT